MKRFDFDKEVFGVRLVISKPISARFWWIFIERDYGFRLFLSSAFTGWGRKFISHSERSRRIFKHFGFRVSDFFVPSRAASGWSG